MILLAFDASTTHLGWALYSTVDHNLLNSGEVKLDGTADQRLVRIIYQGHLRFYGQDFIDRVAIETPYVGKSYRTALQLGRVWGALTALALEYTGDLPIDITPAEAKLAATGRGNAPKDVVQVMVRAEFGLQVVGEHESDAIAVALAASARLKIQELTEIQNPARRATVEARRVGER